MSVKRFVEVWNKNIKFKIDMDRQVTVVSDDGLAGEVHFVRMVEMFYSGGKKGIGLRTNFSNIRIYSGWNIRHILDDAKEAEDALIIVDKGVDFIQSFEFAEYVKSSDNYFLLVCRQSLPLIPYCLVAVREPRGHQVKIGSRVYTEVFFERACPDSLEGISSLRKF